MRDGIPLFDKVRALLPVVLLFAAICSPLVFLAIERNKAVAHCTSKGMLATNASAGVWVCVKPKSGVELIDD